jgi:hypothetical protein
VRLVAEIPGRKDLFLIADPGIEFGIETCSPDPPGRRAVPVDFSFALPVQRKEGVGDLPAERTPRKIADQLH